MSASLYIYVYSEHLSIHLFYALIILLSIYIQVGNPRVCISGHTGDTSVKLVIGNEALEVLPKLLRATFRH